MGVGLFCIFINISIIVIENQHYAENENNKRYDKIWIYQLISTINKIHSLHLWYIISHYRKEIANRMGYNRVK